MSHSRPTRWTLAACALCFIAVLPSAAEQAKTQAPEAMEAASARAEVILKRHREASGAAAHLAGIQTLSMRGTAEAGTMKFEVTERRKRPGKLRLELQMDGQTITQATDGRDAWWLDPVMGSGKVDGMPDTYGSGFRRNASVGDFYLETGDGVSAAYLGSTDADDGRTLDELRITYGDGSSHSRFFDRESGLYVRKRTDGANGGMVADFSDFRRVAGVLMPFRQELSLGQRFIYREAKVNEPMDDEIFSRPAP